MDTCIRNAEPSDLETLVDLLGLLFSIEADFEVDPQRQRRGLARLMDGCQKHACIKVAVVEGRVVGMCSAQTLVSTSEGGTVVLVEDMVVATAWRGRGIGRKLIESICRWADLRSASRLQLLADRTNQEALEFYAKNGWQTTQLICLRKQM
jgi:ribosomal protein S18 acetylase RimI-like enzyme